MYNSLDLLYPPFAEVIKKALKQRPEFVAFETYRSFPRQSELFNNGASRAMAGMSWHNYGLAVDLVTVVNNKPSWEGNYKLIWDIMDQENIEWSGTWTHFPERCHFQWKSKIPITKAKQLAIADGVLSVWASI